MRYAIFFFFGCFASSVDSNIFGQLLKIPNHELLLLLEEFKKYPGIIIFSGAHYFLLESFLSIYNRSRRSERSEVTTGRCQKRGQGAVPWLCPGCVSSSRHCRVWVSGPWRHRCAHACYWLQAQSKGESSPILYRVLETRACVCVLAHTHSHSPCTLLGRIFTPLALGGERRGRVQRWRGVDFFSFLFVCLGFASGMRL